MRKPRKNGLMRLELILVLITLCALTTCAPFRVYKVNGVEILVLKDIKQVFAVYARSFKASIDLALKTKAETLDIVAGSPFEANVVKLYEDLDQVNMDVRNKLVAAYTKYVTELSVAQTPEERIRASQSFDAVQTQVNDLSIEVRKITLQLDSVRVRSSSSEWEKLIEYGDVLKTKAMSIKDIKGN